jgi:hypothetical protein
MAERTMISTNPRNASEARARLELVNLLIEKMKASRPQLKAERKGPNSSRTRTAARAKFEETNEIVSFLINRKRDLIVKRRAFAGERPNKSG